MNFIEQIVGVSVDDGSGSFELLLLLAPVIAVAAFIQRRRNRSKD
jgi:hypothetical protein